MTVILVLALVCVLAALIGAGIFMVKRPAPKSDTSDTTAPADRRMAWALALRVAISVGLFVLVLVSWHFGWITPKGLPTGR